MVKKKKEGEGKERGVSFPLPFPSFQRKGQWLESREGRFKTLRAGPL